jgi:uncharacterized protein
MSSDIPIDNVVPLPPTGEVRWADSFVNMLAGLGVPGRDKFAGQNYVHTPLNVLELESAYRSDWIARKVVTIPAWDMTREWRSWQADPDQIELLEGVEKTLFIQQKLQAALIKARLYGGAVIIIGVDAGKPEEELDLEQVGQDSLKFIHIVSRNQIRAGPIIRDISSKYFGQPEYYEARNEPAPKTFEQEVETSRVTREFGNIQVKVHPSRVIKLIGMDTADQMLSEIWGDSVLQPVNDAVKMCGLVTGSLATLVAELKVDVIKIPELKSILSTQAGTTKMINRFSAANAAKSVINTIMIDGNEEWQRIQASLTGVPETLLTYMQIAAGAADIPATRFLGMSPTGLNATGESDIRNYYDRLAAEQETILTPTMTVLDEVLIRSALGDRPPEVWYEWNSLWQLSDAEKADIALKKAQAYQIDVMTAQLPTVALANARANQLIEDGVYPGLEKALEEAALEGDTIEEHNAEPEMDPAMEAMKLLAESGAAPPPGQPGGPPGGFPGGGKVVPIGKKKAPPPGFPARRAAGDSEPDLVDEDDVSRETGDHNENHDPKTGEFSSGSGGSAGGSGKTGRVARAKEAVGAARDFVRGKGAGEVLRDVAKSEKGQDALATAIGSLLSAGGADPSTWELNEQAAKSALRAVGNALDMGPKNAQRLVVDAVKGLIKRRKKKSFSGDADPEDDEDDEVTALLERLLEQLEALDVGSNGEGGDLADYNMNHGPDGRFAKSSGGTRAQRRREQGYKRAARSAFGGGSGRNWDFPHEKAPANETPEHRRERRERNRKAEAAALSGEFARRIEGGLAKVEAEVARRSRAAVRSGLKAVGRGIARGAKAAVGKLRRKKAPAVLTAPPPKRGRGRPRTRPIKPKRPRGRPRKVRDERPWIDHNECHDPKSGQFCGEGGGGGEDYPQELENLLHKHSTKELNAKEFQKELKKRYPGYEVSLRGKYGNYEVTLPNGKVIYVQS